MDLSRFPELMIKLRWLVIAFWIPPLVCAFWGLQYLTLTADTRVFFDERNPYLLELEAFEKKYSQNNNLLIVVHNPEGSVFDRKILQTLSELTEAAWKLPYASRVDSLANFQRVYASEDLISIESYISPGEDLTPVKVETIRKEALSDSAIVNRLVSQDEQTAGVNINFNLPSRASDEIRTIVESARALIARYETQDNNLSFHVTGNVALMRVFSEAIEMDQSLLIPITLVVSALILAYLLGSAGAVLSVGSILVLSSGAAMGIAGWAGMVLNPASVVAPIVIMILAIASTVHVVSAVQRNVGLGMDTIAAVRAAFYENAAPVTLASLTTAIGFFALNLSSSPPFRDMGNAIIVGIILSFLLIFTWLPAVLSFAGLPPKRPSSDKIMEVMGRTVSAVSPFFLLLVLISSFGAFQGVQNIVLDDDFVRGFDDRFDYARASDFAEENLTGLNILEFDLSAGGPEKAYDPTYLKTVDEFAAWLRGQKHVANVTSIADIGKKVNQAMEGGAVDAYHLPADTSTSAQYFLLYELSLPLGLELSDFVNVDRSSSRLTVLLRHATSGDIRTLNENAQDWLKANAPSHMHTAGTSINVVFAHLSRLTIQSMILSTFISILAISVIIGVTLRSASLGLVSLVTNSLPIAMGFGIWGFLFGQMGLAAAVVTAITFGIVVDDTVHFLAKYQNAMSSLRKDHRNAVIHAFVHAGTPMLITTLAICAGFSILTLSGFEINRTLAALTVIIVSCALLVDWFLLPALLRVLRLFGKSE